MKKLIVLAGAVAMLVAAPAPATTTKTLAVDISKAGFVPADVSITAGDTISWTNKDTANHQVVCKSCPFTSSVLAAGGATTFAFAKAGKYAIIDPLNKNKRASVTVVEAPTTVNASATPHVVNYGAATTISGTLSNAQANEKVQILAQACGDNAPKQVGTATTTAGGAFTFQTQPTINASYQAKYAPRTGAAVTSALDPVSTRPLVGLRKNGTHRFTAQVTASQSFVGKSVLFQRWVVRKHRWQTVKTVFLGSRHAVSAPLNGSTVSAVTFGVRIPSRVSVRVLLPSGQAGPCYITATSATIRS